MALLQILLSIWALFILAPSPIQAQSAHPSPKSVLLELLDSNFSDMVQLLEHSQILHVLETELHHGSNITVFAPAQGFLGSNPILKRFLMSRENLPILRRVLKFHFLYSRIDAENWGERMEQTLSGEEIRLHSGENGLLWVEDSVVLMPNSLISYDGIVHGIDKLTLPKDVEKAYQIFKNEALAMATAPESSVFPPYPSDHSAPESEPLPSSAASAPVSPIPAEGDLYKNLPLKAPSYSSVEIGDEIISSALASLMQFGGYNEAANLLANFTAIGTELARLIQKGSRITLLVPCDRAFSVLSTENVSSSGGVEAILMAHIIADYQTEENFFKSVSRFGAVAYDSLKNPFKLIATEFDGRVKFQLGDGSAVLQDQNIFADGRLSIQGIDTVLLAGSAASSHSADSSTISSPANTAGTNSGSSIGGNLWMIGFAILGLLIPF